MTDEMMNLRTLLEKSADADLLREMIGFAAQRLMELDVESLTGAAHGARDPDRINHRNGHRDRSGRRAPAWSSCASRSCAREATSQGSWSRGAWPRRRSPPSSRRPMCTASRRGPWTIWSRRWA